MNKINLQGYRAAGSKIYSGRDIGKKARKELDLNNKDSDQQQYKVVVPSDTYSINGSFFGGLFSDSVIKLGESEFRGKYEFVYEDDKHLNEILSGDIEDGIYDAINGL